MECWKTKERWTIEAFFFSVFLHPLGNPRQSKNKPFIGLMLVVMWFIPLMQFLRGKSHITPCFRAITLTYFSVQKTTLFYTYKCQTHVSPLWAQALCRIFKNLVQIFFVQNFYFVISQRFSCVLFVSPEWPFFKVVCFELPDISLLMLLGKTLCRR